MLKIHPKLVTVLSVLIWQTCIIALSGCASVMKPEMPEVPTVKQTPPDGALTECDSLAAIPTDRPTEPSEFWPVILQNNGVFMDCRSKYDFLRGWVAGTLSGPPEPEPEPKRGLFGVRW